MKIRIRSKQLLDDRQKSCLEKVENEVVQKIDNIEMELACFGVHTFSIEIDIGDHLYITEIQTAKFKEQE